MRTGRNPGFGAVALLGALLLLGGFYLYVRVGPEWQRAQSMLVQLASELSPSLQQQVETIRAMHFGSLGAMTLGGILVLVGLINERSALLAGLIALLVAAGGAYSLQSLKAFSGSRSDSSTVQRRNQLHQLDSRASYVPRVDRQNQPAASPEPADIRRSYLSEAANGLQEIKTLEWAYFQQYGTFTTDLSLLDFKVPPGSAIIFTVYRADSSEVVIAAFNRALGPAPGIMLELTLNADGTSSYTKYRY